MRRRAPRSLAEAASQLSDMLAPAGPLAALQRAWPEVVGEAIARESQPTGVRDGVLTVGCHSAVWAHELQLLGPRLLTRLNAGVDGVELRALRCVALPPSQDG